MKRAMTTNQDTWLARLALFITQGQATIKATVQTPTHTTAIYQSQSLLPKIKLSQILKTS
jgi:hypothetical protein